MHRSSLFNAFALIRFWHFHVNVALTPASRAEAKAAMRQWVVTARAFNREMRYAH